MTTPHSTVLYAQYRTVAAINTTLFPSFWRHLAAKFPKSGNKDLEIFLCNKFNVQEGKSKRAEFHADSQISCGSCKKSPSQMITQKLIHPQFSSFIIIYHSFWLLIFLMNFFAIFSTVLKSASDLTFSRPYLIFQIFMYT